VALSAFDSDAFDTDAFSDDAFLFAEAGVTVPDVVGQSQAAGTATLEGDGFVVAVGTAYSSTVPAGEIISQSPAGGVEAPAGSTVTITVSLGEAPAPPPQSEASGGFWYDYDIEQSRRRRKKREQEEREAEARELKDKVDAEIALLLARQEAEAERQAELDRLQRLVKAHSGAQLELSDRAKIAYVRALTQANFSAMEALDRELQRQIEEEDFAVLMLLLNDP
jgi:hypothetical protein